MPNIKSAKKALRQNKRRRSRNIKKKDKIHFLTKEVRRLLNLNNTEEAKKILPQVYKALDKATKTGVLQENTASRRKSYMSHLIKKRATTKAPAAKK